MMIDLFKPKAFYYWAKRLRTASAARTSWTDRLSNDLISMIVIPEWISSDSRAPRRINARASERE